MLPGSVLSWQQVAHLEAGDVPHDGLGAGAIAGAAQFAAVELEDASTWSSLVLAGRRCSCVPKPARPRRQHRLCSAAVAHGGSR